MNKRIFFTTYLLGALGLVAYGIIAVIKPTILFDPFSRHVYQFPPEAGTAVAYLLALFRLLGYFSLVFGAVCLYLLCLFHQSQKLSWAIFTPLLGYLGPIIFDNTVGSIGFFEIIEHLLFIAMILGGAALLKEKRDRSLRGVEITANCQL